MDGKDAGGATADDLIADIAGIFHWPLSELAALDIIELDRWHRLAVKWWNSHRAGKD